MINIEHLARSISELEKRRVEKNAKEIERRQKRAAKVQQMIEASADLFQTRPDIEELPAVKIQLHNNRVKIGREFEQHLAERGVFFNGSDEWLLDFLKNLTKKPVRTFLSRFKGSRKHSDASFDLESKIPGLIINRELLPDKNNPRFSAVYYTFVRKGE